MRCWPWLETHAAGKALPWSGLGADTQVSGSESNDRREGRRYWAGGGTLNCASSSDKRRLREA